MAGLFEYLRFRVFAQATEDPDRVRAALKWASHAPHLEATESRVEGSYGNPIVVLETDVRAVGRIRGLFEALLASDPQGFARLIDEAPRRIDENLNFYLRLDKQEAYGQRAVLSTEDDAILVRARIRSLAAKQTSAEEEMVSFLREIQSRQEK